MENFKMWIDELKEGIKTNNTVKVENAEKELKEFYGIILMQNEQFKEEIEDLESRLDDEDDEEITQKLNGLDIYDNLKFKWNDKVKINGCSHDYYIGKIGVIRNYNNFTGQGKYVVVIPKNGGECDCLESELELTE